MSFKLYDKGGFGNLTLLNSAGLALVECLKKLFSSNSEFYDIFIDADIYVTSVNRPEGDHATGHAIDITCSKYPYVPLLYAFLQSAYPKNTIFLSSYNRHIHFTDIMKGRHGVEVMKKKDGVYLPTNYKSVNWNGSVSILPETQYGYWILYWYGYATDEKYSWSEPTHAKMLKMLEIIANYFGTS